MLVFAPFWYFSRTIFWFKFPSSYFAQFFVLCWSTSKRIFKIDLFEEVQSPNLTIKIKKLKNVTVVSHYKSHFAVFIAAMRVFFLPRRHNITSTSRSYWLSVSLSLSLSHSLLSTSHLVLSLTLSLASMLTITMITAQIIESYKIRLSNLIKSDYQTL